MPMIPNPVGALPFIGIKLAGYTAFAGYLNHEYGKLRFTGAEAARGLPNPLSVGVVRTLVGIVGGVFYAALLAAMFKDLPEVAVFVALAPLRGLEWMLLIWLLYDRTRRYGRALAWRSLQGMAVSYLLDIPAFGLWFLLPGVPMC